MGNGDYKTTIGAALVVGGGIGGMQAALDLAESGIKVYLVETKPCIGGVMSQLDKTFPTNDCAMCTMAPRLVDVGRHKDIEIITLADIDDITGEPGNFTVRLKKKARYIREDKCTGCGECEERCPIEIFSEYNLNLNKSKAIYRLYPQAIPNYFAIRKAGRSPCSFNCPAEQKVQGYIALIRQKRYEDAYRVIVRDNPFPSICGRVCNHRCEDECTRGQVDEPVSIMALKRFIADWAFEKNIQPVIPKVEKSAEASSKRVAIIGSGPAGLAAAQDLKLKGYDVTVFEALPVAGGMMCVGIPEYRLPRERLQWDIKNILACGIELKTGQKVESINGLFKEGYNAVFIAAGTHKGYKMKIPNEEAQGILDGTEFLRRINLGQEVTLGQKVIVVGGGNTAIDAARVARRLGKEVTILYRRTRDEMPAKEDEVEEALIEGINIQFLSAPVKAIVKDGTITSLECIKMKLGDVDASGRRMPVPLEGSNFTLSVDTLIPAIGQGPDLPFTDDGFEFTKRGTIKVDPDTLATSKEGVFAGGDVVTGPAFVINAIAAGHKAAKSIDLYLSGKPLERAEVKPAKVELTPEQIREKITSKKGRHKAPMAADEVRRSFDEVQLGYTEEQALAEAERCLNCGICSECLMCVESCKAGAIDHSMPAVSTLELNVGAVILSPGFELFKLNIKREYGYGRFPNVISNLEFERILSPSGPFGGKVLRPSDNGHPKKIAFIQCVGSREVEHQYCSSICCVAATKEAIIAKEHSPDIDCTIFYIDMRTFAKGYERYFNRAKESGIKYIRSRPSSIKEISETNDLLMHYYDEEGNFKDEIFNMVVLSAGFRPPAFVNDLSEKLGIELNEFGFCKTEESKPVETSCPGIYVCGPFSSPKDIPETVMQASAAASKVSGLLVDARGTLIKKKEFPPERDVTKEAPRVGVFVCHCGTNIASVVDVEQVVQYAMTLPGVEYAERNLYTCSTDSQQRIKEKIAEFNLNRVIVASCTPRTHEVLFQETIREAGLNFYLFEMANIRDQCSWVHMKEPEKATEKAKDLLRIAVAKVKLDSPLYKRPLKINNNALVIGGGISGMTAAVELANQGFNTYLIERSGELGGNLRRISALSSGINPMGVILELENKINSNKRITLYKNETLKEVTGSLGNFKSTISSNGHDREIEHGVIIVATGARPYKPDEYLYGQDERVVLNIEMEEYLSREDLKFNDVVFIQCVGSRNEERPYCSRICCSQAVKNAIRIKQLRPESKVYILYREIRTYGFLEKYYRQARELGVIFIRYPDDIKPTVAKSGNKLMVTVNDQMLREDITINADLLVLSSAVVADEGNKELAQKLKVPLTEDNFFLEAHKKLRPVDFASDGIFLCGLAHSPMLMEESIAQATGAAARAATILSKEIIELEPTISLLDESKCDGCAYCVDPCPFKAITLFEYEKEGVVKKMVKVDEALCKGCGTCMATCPKDAVHVRHFELNKLRAEVMAALGIEE